MYKKLFFQNKRPLIINTVLVLLFMATTAVFAEPSNRKAANAPQSNPFDDLIIGVPAEDIGTLEDAGAVIHALGGGTGIQLGTAVELSQDDVSGAAPELNDGFGEAVASGDFNGDGYYDLAVGVPQEDVGAVEDAGGVHIFSGTATGELNYTRSLQGGAVEEDDIYGHSLAVGDFNADGFDDLAIGAPGEDVTVNGVSQNGAGAIHIVYSSGSSGLSTENSEYWSQQDIVGIGAEEGDWFGFAMTSDDFNGDGYDDLVVSAPLENNDQGIVTGIFGSSDGLQPTGTSSFNYDTAPKLGYGYTLASGNINGDDYDDLVIGFPLKTVVGVEQVGGLQIVYGTFDGLREANNDHIVPNIPSEGARTGWSLAVGDFNDDDYDDIALGIPGIDAINALYGRSEYGIADFDVFDQDDDSYGAAVTTGDFNGDGFDDVAIGAPDASFTDVNGTHQFAGRINVVFGGNDGLTSAGSQDLAQGSNSLGGNTELEAVDRTGEVLATLPHNYTPCHDAYEPNDNPNLLVASVGSGQYADLGICEDDDDYFKVTVAAGNTLTAVATFTHADGDLDLQFRDANLAFLAESDSSTDNETLTWENTTGGDATIYIRVYGFAGATNAYALDIDLGDASCENDSFEPNDTTTNATLISSGMYNDLKICEGESDYFEISAEAGQEIEVTAFFTHADGDLDMYLYDADEVLQDSSASVTDNETISFPVQTTDTYFLEVRGYTGATNDYSLELNVLGQVTAMFGISQYEVSEGMGTLSIPVQLSSPAVGDVTVTYATSSDSALAGFDFADAIGSLQIADGSSSGIIFITLIDDSDIEPTESFLVTLTGATNATVGSPDVLPITIIDNDQPTGQQVNFSAANYSVAENVGFALVEVTLSQPSPFGDLVEYTTSSGTAIAGSDFTTSSGTVVFIQGEQTKTIMIPIIDDVALEGDESFSITLSNPLNSELGSTSSTTVTIMDDDGGGSTDFVLYLPIIRK